ncbi:MAG: molybdopterin converting factor subunit 1 [Hyphomicrobiales bacterium]|nr:molybdopterin converting factor subunit 1 [Hyphomicrobiales bacterium]MDE2016575.1 molybdopterin converting factor subunit 1 [Hyphomicrobiales bacterium]
MKVLYFASVRERVGLSEEEISPPAGVATVADLMRWLAGRGETHAAVFATPAGMRAAVDRVHAKPGAAIAGAREIAFFPPMTGG